MNVKKFFLIVVIVLLATLSALGGVLTAWISSHPFSLGDHGNALAEISSNGIINVLVAGKDVSGANTDVLMVVSVNPKQNNISILSVPRDTRVYVKGYRKINSVYSFAEATGAKKEETLIRAVSDITGLPIHYFAIINLRAFREIVDELGGVEFNVQRPYHYDDPYQDLHIHIDPGLQILDGEKAEGLIRYRHDYAMGDIQRLDVQQEFISAMVKQKLNVRYIAKVPAVYDKVTEYVVSNLRISDVLDLAKTILGCETNSYVLPGATGESNGYWIQNADKTRELIRDKFGYTDEN